MVYNIKKVNDHTSVGSMNIGKTLCVRGREDWRQWLEANFDKEKEIYRAQVLEMGKPDHIADKIVDGKLQKYFKDNCLMNQAYVRNPDITVADKLNEVIAKIGENITIKRFSRYKIGES